MNKTVIILVILGWFFLYRAGDTVEVIGPFFIKSDCEQIKEEVKSWGNSFFNPNLSSCWN